MKKIVDFIIYSNLFIALCCTALTLQTALIFEDIGNSIFEYAVINFIATFCLYNLQRLYYSAKHEDNPKYSWYTKHRRVIFTLIILLLLVSFNFLWHFFIDNTKHLIVYSMLSIISILYFLPPLQLKKYGILKPFLISAVFVLIAILIPLNFKITTQIIFYTIAQWFFIGALCVLFDVRDIEADKEKKINTVPILAGIKNTKIIAIGLFCIYLVLSLFINNNELTFSALVTFCLSIVITLICSIKRNNYFYLVLVDGLILLQLIFIITYFFIFNDTNYQTSKYY
jgi:4-hydroxybenzoate polyprenyltransferase